jgi:alanine-glyoxylate transaminase/serine-glyoxylate transaminase/serine-pyruvate transaminase
MSYALYEAVRIILEEGLENCFERHLNNHLALKAGLAVLGIDYTAQTGHQLPMLNAVTVPEGVDDAALRRDLLNRFGIEIGGGLGAFKGKVWRLGTTPGGAGGTVRTRGQYCGCESALPATISQRVQRISSVAGRLATDPGR